MALSKILENSITDGVVSSAKLKDFSAAVDLNGVELILDDDQDTSITADTDDRIDFKIANTDHISIGTSSGDTVIKAMTDAKDIIFQQFDGKSILEINDGGFVAIANGASSGGELRIYEDTDLGTDYSGFTVGNLTESYTLALPNADGSSGQALTTNGSGVLSFTTVSSAADDLTIGDAAILLTTSAGNITIDAAGNDTDIIFKGTDGGADRVFMTIDGSAGGDLFLTGGLIDLQNDGSAVSQIKFYCESSNAHAQTLIGAPHSETATNTLTLPSTGGNSYLLTAASTATVTNKTLTSPVINTGTFGTSILPTSADGTTLGSASKEFSDLFLADASTIQFGNDQDVTLTHVADAGIMLNTTMQLRFRDSAISIGSPADGDLDINADDEIELNSTLIDINGNVEISGTLAQADAITMATNKKIIFRDAAIHISSTADGDLSIAADDEIDITSTLIDINGNVEISGTATTTGVHTFTAVPVFPNNTVESADIQADAITGAKIADDAIDSEHITDGSVDHVHLAGDAVDGDNLADNAVDSEHYTDASIDLAHLAADSVDGSKIVDNAINSEHYTDGSIDTAHIADAQVTLAKTTGLVGKQSIWVPAAAMTPTVSNGCAALVSIETTAGRPDMNVLDFDKDADEHAQFSIAFPNSWNLGTVTFQAFWSGIAATTGVSWMLQGVAMNDNETIDVVYGTAVKVDDDAQGAVEELLVTAESAAVTIAGTPADNDLCYFRFYRDVSQTNDDMAGDCRLHGIKIFYTTDALNDA